VNVVQNLLPLEPQARERVWGGQRLLPHHPPIGELWCAFEDSRISSGHQAGRTVGELTTDLGASFVGSVVASRFPGRFPLLIKLLDCADWLSVQVHPNDEQARQLEGTQQCGKTEAWHFIEAEPGAMILSGTRQGTTPDELAAAIRTGRILDVSLYSAVHPGETYLLHAGTMHALGPGLMLYEVQQSSDITYRVFDWDRPASAGRQLHIEQAVAVTDAQRQAVRTSPAISSAAASTVAVGCSYFVLDVLNLAETPATADTAFATFHVLTVKSGSVLVACSGETARLKKYDTALVAASAGTYAMHALEGSAAVLRARVPDR